MQRFSRRNFLEKSCLAAGAWLAGARISPAAILPGVETVASPVITGEESSAQRDMWALEVRYKPIRMISVEMPEPKTGKISRQLVWYLAYRVVVRESSHVPAGTKDRPVFVPELTLVGEDQGNLREYPDQVFPVAQAAINKRERHKYKNSVEIVGPLPPAVADNARTFPTLDGIATWVGVDPNTDFFSVYFTGFSNGYRVEPGPDGKEIVLRRTLHQKFWRPSDRFDQSESEVRLKDDPTWIYR